ncbi:MAG: DEAD/DEAH box helicase [Planctomycetota bacterium]
MSFAELNLSPVLDRNLRSMGYRTPRPIQAQAYHPIREGRDTIGLAKTGMGKTAAFITPIADALLADKPAKGKKTTPAQRLRALVLCPTRELAQQVQEEARQIVANTFLRTEVAYGKVGMKSLVESLRTGVDLLVATPGRIHELLDADAITLGTIRHVVIDEADRMFDMGFLPQVRKILDRTPAERQIALFTATFPKDVAELAERFQKNAVRVEVDPHTTPVEHITQRAIAVENADKVPMLLHMLEKAPKRGVLIFCRTRRRVGWVASALKRHDVSVNVLHGDRTQAQRQRALANLDDGSCRVVVATDVASRGLHIRAVTWVINYDVPNEVEDYVHRIGRAGHGGGKGDAWTFVAKRDVDAWRECARTLKLNPDFTAVEGFTPTASGEDDDIDGVPRWAMIADDDRPAKRRRRGKRPPGGRGKGMPVGKGERPGGGVKKIAPRVPGPDQPDSGQAG